MFNGFEQKSIMDNSGRSSIYLIFSSTKYDPIHRKTIRCRYKIRKDHYKNKPQTLIFGNIEDFCSQPKTYLSFQKEFFKFIDKNNISIRTTSSSEMFHVMELAFESGITVVREIFLS